MTLADAASPAISVKGVTKAFAGHVAVKRLDLDVPRGSVFGLLGPNGAGKTTTLRMVLNILAPDEGSIRVLGEPAGSAVRDRIGYMPEERGLYPRMVLEEQILFLTSIKGVERRRAAQALPAWLDRMGLDKWRSRRVNELSKGMQQKAQFIATVLHDPDVLILDEPMSGLDPVGMDVMAGALDALRRQGKTLVLSSHQMHTVEQLCDRVALINAGEKILDGALRDVKAGRARNSIAIEYEGDGAFLRTFPGVASVEDGRGHARINGRADLDPQLLLREAAQRVRIRRFELVEPSLHDIFVEEVTRHGAAS